MTSNTVAHSDLSPILLSYAAALRNVTPLKPQDAFTYAHIGGFVPLSLLCLAASNPQGQFYAMVKDKDTAEKIQTAAQQREVRNVVLIDDVQDLPKNLNYLCYEDLIQKPKEDDEIFKIAEDHLAPNGVLCYRYRAYNNMTEALSFLVEELAPEMSDEQVLELCEEFKVLGHNYFKNDLVHQGLLGAALEKKDPSLFFTPLLPQDGEDTVSGTFETMKALLPRKFSFAGSANISENYIQMSAPIETHKLLETCKDQLLYEVIKDFVMCRDVRSDIWVRQPVEQSDELSELFGFFTYGITMPRDQVPQSIDINGTNINFNTPLFMRLIDLMCTLPTAIGDFLSHPSGSGMDPAEVVSAVQVLVACGLAQPMRTHYEGSADVNANEPAWSVEFNDYLTHSPINDENVILASTITGAPFALSAREALVLQAFSRVGVANSAGVVQPELKRIIDSNPALAATITDVVDLSDDAIHEIVTSTMQKSMARWYAYGILAA